MLLIVAVCNAAQPNSTGKSNSAAPDFAFPKQVTQNAEKDIEKALKKSDSKLLLRSLIDLTLAQGAIGNDKVPAVYKRIQETIAYEKDPAIKSLLNLLAARICLSSYDQNRWKYNDRNLPLTPLPDDWTEWSGDQYRNEIIRMLENAVIPADDLRNIPLKEYSSIVTHNDQTFIYYPTLFDFVGYQYISMLKSIGSVSSCLSVRLMVDAPDFIKSSRFVSNNPYSKKILDMYARLLEYNSQRIAPEINYNLERLEYTVNHIYSSQQDEANDLYKKLLENLYSLDFDRTEYSGDILIKLLNIGSYGQSNNKKKDYERIKDFLKRYPSYWKSSDLKYKLKSFERPSLNVRYPAVVAPGKSIKLKVNSENVSNAKLKVYRVPDKLATNNKYKEILPSNCKLVGEYPLTFNGSVPFAADTTVSITIDDYGVYYPVVESDNTNKPSSLAFYNCFRVTNIRGASMTLDNALFISTDITTGKPISDVEFTAKLDTYRKNSKITLGKSNENGILNIYKSQLPEYGYYDIYPTKGADRWSSYFHTSINEKVERRRISLDLFTDLPIYHPGDTVTWSAVIYEYDTLYGKEKKPSSNRKVNATWLNANYTQLDSIDLITDSYGRVDGHFVVPKGELTGNYRIALNADKENEIGGFEQFNVMVSDYKMPTFYITMENPQMNTPTKDAVTINGKVTTYSGVGLSNTMVRLNLSAGRDFFWRNADLIEFYSDSTTTDAEGRFSLELSADLLDNSPAPNGTFKAEISATSPSGESQQQSQTFRRSETYTLSVNLTDNSRSANVSNPVKLSMSITDAKQKKVNLPVIMTITNSSDTIISRIISSEAGSIDLSSIPTGTYDIGFRLENESSNTVSLNGIAIYRSNDSASPSSEPLWINTDKNIIKLEKGKSTEILYAVPANDSYVLYTLFADGKMIEHRWIKSDAGVHSLKLSIPKDYDNAYVLLYSSRNYDFSFKGISLRQYNPADELKIISESFRDNIVPGSKETWTFRTVDGKGLPLKSAIIMGMSNYALYAINNQTWPNGLSTSIYSSGPESSSVYSGFNVWNASFSNYRNSYSAPSLIRPEFNTYGMPFFNKRLYIRGAKLYKTEEANFELTEAEFAYDEGSMSTSGVVAAGYAAPTSFADRLNNMTPGISTTESGVVEDAMIVTSDSDEKQQTQADFTYRNGETTLAFFKPNLTTDNDGRMSLSFDVPNANTTWLLQGFAYSDRLASSSVSKLIVANKPVMVTPNLPRFVRANDIVDVSALVINNSDSLQHVATKIEIFNPLTNEIICCKDTVADIAPRQSATALIKLTVPAELTTIGYRVKSSIEGFADGEQNLIPVLPVISSVIETVPFYISPDSANFTMTIPKTGDDASVTLEYCDNPLWYVVTALPGLTNVEYSTAQDAADAIFSVAVAEGLLRDNPTLVDALRQWSESDRSDSTLVSMLQRNADLKIMLLKATPWVVAAMSDTERMQRLALLFDKKEIRSVYENAISALKKMHKPEGGWSWTIQSDIPSEWATEQTLYIFGCLNRLGYLPSDSKLMSMIKSALSWHQKEIEKTYRKYPDMSFYSYLQLRDLWPSIKPSQTGSTIIRREIQRIVKNWKDYDIANKAACAMLLNHNGYSKLAQTVMQSVSEFAETSPGKGMWWPSVGDSYGGELQQLRIASTALMAYKELMPQSKNIDKIRQWLIIQKQAQNWGVGSMPSEIITAILTTSPSWIQPAGNVDIKVGKTQIKSDYADSYFGNLRVDLSKLNPSEARLDITRTALTPAWGAILSRSAMKMSEIKSSSCEDLSIEKRIYRQNGTEWEEVKEYKVGDRVKVQLLIHANRDMQYVAITDDRSASLEPIEQLPKPIYSEGICFYRENRDSSTNMFVTNLPKGTYMLSYELWVNNAGTFSSGIATAQSQYAPALSAHSAGSIMHVNP